MRRSTARRVAASSSDSVASSHTASVDANRVTAPSRSNAGVTGTSRLRPASLVNMGTDSMVRRASASASLAPRSCAGHDDTV
jgi:hypothetical protein